MRVIMVYMYKTHFKAKPFLPPLFSPYPRAFCYFMFKLSFLLSVSKLYPAPSVATNCLKE